MLLSSVLLPSVLVPTAAALLVLLLLWLSRKLRPSIHPFAAPRGGSGPLALAFLAAYVAMADWPRFPPVEATQRLFFLVLAGLLLTYGIRRSRQQRWRLLAFTVLVVPALWWILESQITHRWSLTSSVSWIAGLAILGLLLHWSWTRSIWTAEAIRGTGPGTGAVGPNESPSRVDPLWAAALRPTLLGGAALCLGLSGSALLGQLMGALAAADATVEAWQFFRREQVWRQSDAPVWTISIGGLLVIGFFYSELPWLPASLLIMALLLLGFNQRDARIPMRLLLMAPLVIAVALVVWAEFNQPTDEYDYYSTVAIGGEAMPARA